MVEVAFRPAEELRPKWRLPLSQKPLEVKSLAAAPHPPPASLALADFTCPLVRRDANYILPVEEFSFNAEPYGLKGVFDRDGVGVGQD